jgi:hypothetical protein
MEASIVVALIAALAAVTSAVYTARSAARASLRSAEVDDRAAVRQIEAGVARRVAAAYERTLGGMQAEIDRQARQINALQRQVARLTRQIRAAGLVPVTSSEEDEGT